MPCVITAPPRTSQLEVARQYLLAGTWPALRDGQQTLRCRFQVSLTDGRMHKATDYSRIARAPFAFSDLQFACSAPAAQHARHQTSKMFAALSPPAAPPWSCAPSKTLRCVPKYRNPTSSSQPVCPPKRGVCSKGPRRLENYNKLFQSHSNHTQELTPSSMWI